MDENTQQALKRIPSVDRLLGTPELSDLTLRYGRVRVRNELRRILADHRLETAGGKEPLSVERLAQRVASAIEQTDSLSLRLVFNLTGTVLHTNLGRAPLPQDVVARLASLMSGFVNLEFELSSGRRGRREAAPEVLLCELTGAEAACLVNNNAAALFLILNSLAGRRDVLVSRGELIEIGGGFRLPEVMSRSGCRLVEVGTTNRTRLSDFEEKLTPRSALILKAHTSNFAVVGFTEMPSQDSLAELAQRHGLPFVIDLGSGALVDMSVWGLPREPTVQQALRDGADLVCFSGDKLLGGPQAGIIVGKSSLIAKLEKNPLKRALRLDKLTLAVLDGVLKQYRNPEQLVQSLPTFRLLARTVSDIELQARRILPLVEEKLAGKIQIEIRACESEIGSGAQPLVLLPSWALVLWKGKKKSGGDALDRLASALRSLPVPVLGRVTDGALWLDLRCLEDESGFVAQLDQLSLPAN